MLTKLAEYEVVLIRADLTQQNPSMQKDLEEFDRGSVPVNVIGSANSREDAIILPEIFGPGEVVEALDQAAASGSK